VSYTNPLPAQTTIPVTKDCDTVFTVKLSQAGQPVTFPGPVHIDIDIDKTEPTRIPVLVVTDTAIVRIEPEIGNQVRNSTKWRLRASLGRYPYLEIPIVVGNFERCDGKASDE
jgi:hypothetical protein